MTAQDLAKEICLEEHFDKGSDRFIIGDRLKEVRKIAVCMVITLDVLKIAIEKGADMIITHEPTFLHSNDECDVLFYEEKRRMLEDAQITVFRWHDSSHFGDTDLVHKAFVEKMNLEGTFDGKFILELQKPISPLDFVDKVCEKLDIKHPRIVGKRDGSVKKIGLYLGARGDKPYHDMLTNDIDLAVSGELCEWHAAEPVRDMAQAGLQKSIVILGHVASEREAMKVLSGEMNSRFANKNIESFYIECGELYSYID